LGMLITPDAATITPASGSTWRDMAFDPATGNLYLRNQYGVVATNRTGPNADINPLNSTAGQSGYIYINSGTLASNNVGVTIGYMNTIASSTFNAFTNGYSGDLLVFNDRGSTANGQSWTNVIKFASTSGSAVTPNWTFLSAPATGNGAYDYEWDAATQTLAVVDYANRNVSIFSTAVPEPSTLTVAGLCTAGLTGLMLRRRRRREDASATT
jgi:LPXTG-motif cell wall-anchored protein